MTEPAVLQNQQPVGTRGRPPTDFNTDPVLSCLERQPTIGRNELPIPPAVDVEAHMIDDPPNQNGRINAAHNMRLAEVDLAAVRGAEAVAYHRLLQDGQEDLQAVRTLLNGRPRRENVIAARHYWLVLRQLRKSLPVEVVHGMWGAQEYARVLESLARVLILLSKEHYNAAPIVHPLCYECALTILQEKTPDLSCPVAYGECLDRLCEEITNTGSLIRVSDGVYVTKDREQFARRLRSLAAFVLQCV